MVLTEIEKLDGKYPRLAFAVKSWFDQGTSSEKIPALLQQLFGVEVTSSVVESYRRKRWVPEKEFVRLKSAVTKAAIEAFGGDAGFDSLLLAKLWELMDKMTIPQLLTARALFIKIKAQNLKEQEFLFKTGQLKPGQASGPEIDPETRSRNALRKFKEIFGLAGDEPPKPRMQKIPETVGAASSETQK